MKRKLGKSIVSMVLAAVMCLSLLPMSAFAADSDFVIENGVLTRYKGEDSHVVIPDGVTSIGKGAFRDSGITGVTIPDSVTSIGDVAFYYCRSLTSVTIPDSVTSIGTQTFGNCDLRSVTIPDSVTSIGEFAFSFNENLTSINIPDSVTSISGYTFSSCKSLTSVTIPDSVTSIDDGAFRGCDNLTKVTIPKNVESIGSRGVFYETFQDVTLKNVTIYGEVNTAAERYAKEQGIPFAAIGGTMGPTTPEKPEKPEKPTEPTQLTSQLPGQVIPLTDDEFKWYVEFIGYLRELKTIFPLIVNDRAAYQNAKDQFASKDAKILLEAKSLRVDLIVANAQKMLQRFPAGSDPEMLKGLNAITTGFKTITNPYLDDYDYNKTVGLLEELITQMEAMYTSLYGPIDNTAPTTTDKPSAWAETQVNTAIAANIVPQALQGKYTQATTRAEFAALAVALYEKVKGAEIAERQTFSDTTDINVQKAAAIGVVSGVGNNNFAPNDKLTREQAATMLSRLAAAIGKPLTEQAATFADNNKVSSWASAAVGQAQASGIMGGVGNNTFAPQDDYTREQSIITITRLFDIVK